MSRLENESFKQQFRFSEICLSGFNVIGNVNDECIGCVIR